MARRTNEEQEKRRQLRQFVADATDGQCFVYNGLEMQHITNQAYRQGVLAEARFWDERVMPWSQQIQRLWGTLAHVDTIAGFVGVANARVREMLRGSGGLTLDEKLMQDFMRLARLGRRIDETQEGINELGRYCTERAEGIQRMLTEQDNGEFLRDVVQASTGRYLERIFGRLSAIKPGGRPKGISRWRYWLACQWADYKAEHPGADDGAVLNALIGELEETQRARSLSPDERRALHSLKGVQYGRVAKYRRRLFKAAGLDAP